MRAWKGAGERIRQWGVDGWFRLEHIDGSDWVGKLGFHNGPYWANVAQRLQRVCSEAPELGARQRQNARLTPCAYISVSSVNYFGFIWTKTSMETIKREHQLVK